MRNPALIESSFSALSSSPSSPQSPATCRQRNSAADCSASSSAASAAGVAQTLPNKNFSFIFSSCLISLVLRKRLGHDRAPTLPRDGVPLEEDARQTAIQRKRGDFFCNGPQESAWRATRETRD